MRSLSQYYGNVRSDTIHRFRVGAVVELMREHGLSASAFASSIGVTRQAVGSYLGGVTAPQFATVLKMVERFDKPIDFFVESHTAPIESQERTTG